MKGVSSTSLLVARIKHHVKATVSRKIENKQTNKQSMVLKHLQSFLSHLFGRGMREAGSKKPNWKQLHRFSHCIILLQQRSTYASIHTHTQPPFFFPFLGMGKQRLTLYTRTYLALYKKSVLFCPFAFISFEMRNKLSFCKLSGAGPWLLWRKSSQVNSCSPFPVG